MNFKFFLGGYGGGHFEVHLQKDKLFFFVGFMPMSIRPESIPNYILAINNDTDWIKLISFIENLEWDNKYYNNDVLDGTQWRLEFNSPNKHLHSFGSNEYPDDFNKLITILKKITKKDKELYYYSKNLLYSK